MLSRRPNKVSNIEVAQFSKLNAEYYIFFSVENLTLVYYYNIETQELKRVVEEDLLSPITAIAYEDVTNQLYISIENRQLWRLSCPEFRFNKLSTLPKEAISISCSQRYLCFLFENNTIMVRDIITQERIESLSVSISISNFEKKKLIFEKILKKYFHYFKKKLETQKNFPSKNNRQPQHPHNPQLQTRSNGLQP